MAITIAGIKVNDVHLKITEGVSVIETASYSLISSTGKVLAKQTIGGYNNMTLEPSSETSKALRLFMELYVHDVQSLLGLLE